VKTHGSDLESVALLAKKYFVDPVLRIERPDPYGNAMDAGGTDLLGPGDTFSTSLAAGQYRYYCSKDRSMFGTITVLATSYPCP